MPNDKNQKAMLESRYNSKRFYSLFKTDKKIYGIYLHSIFNFKTLFVMIILYFVTNDLNKPQNNNSKRLNFKVNIIHIYLFLHPLQN